MAKNLYIRLFYLFISIPVVIFSFILLAVNKRVRYGLHLSRKTLVYCPTSDHEKLLITHLISGEDHRFYNHNGFDPIAILRAIYKRMEAGKLEGASTIEQQYVRTCTARYDISIIRKCEEIAMASLLSITARKDVIAYSYLKIAYYGYELNDIGCAVAKLNKIYSFQYDERHLAGAIISLLKNPIPKNITVRWKEKHTKRALYIIQRHEQKSYGT